MKTSSRPYRSELREEQARATRKRAFDAARELFVERGYAATTMSQVAARAGIALPTLTKMIGNKRALLEEALRFAVRADEAGAASLRQQLKSAMAAADEHELLQRVAALSRSGNERAFELFEIFRNAVGADPELEQRRRAGAEDRRRSQLKIARELHRRGVLRKGISTEAAADVLWLYTSSEVYRLLSHERGWAPKRLDQWLHKSLVDALL